MEVFIFLYGGLSGVDNRVKTPDEEPAKTPAAGDNQRFLTRRNCFGKKFILIFV
jgi:hypothetical protein